MAESYRVERILPQTFTVEVCGADAAEFGGEDLPDVVEYWARAVSLGLLGDRARERASARVAASRYDAAQSKRAWDVEVDTLDFGAFLVLSNMLRARSLESISLRSSPVPGREREGELNFAALDFPALPEGAPFGVNVPDPAKEAPEFWVGVSMPGASDAVIDAVIATLDFWGELIALGGYAQAGTNPRRSGAMPAGAILYDPVTVAQTFDSPFFADFAAFNAVINYAARLAQDGAPVTTVTIR